MNSFDWASLVLRVCLGSTMALHGLNHWLGGGRIPGTAQWFEGVGLRYGVAQAWASVVTELAAAAGLIAGLLTPLACAAVIGTMTVAFVTVHRSNGFFVFREGYEYVLVLAVAAAVTALLGPGRVSLDNVLGVDLGPTSRILVAVCAGVGGAIALLAATYRPSRTPAPDAPGSAVSAQPDLRPSDR